MTEQGTPETPSSISIPSSDLGGAKFKKGDTITLRITDVTDEGVEAEYEGPDKKDENEPPNANEELDGMSTSASQTGY